MFIYMYTYIYVPIIRSIIQKEVPNPTACNPAHKSPACRPPASVAAGSSPSSRRATPDSVSVTASQICTGKI